MEVATTTSGRALDRGGRPPAAASTGLGGRLVGESRKRFAHLLNLLLPPLALLAAVVVLWDRVVGPTDLAILALMYAATGFAITSGFHRLLTHRSFKTYPAIYYGFAMLGSMALQGSPVDWVADHRKHHAHADHDGDPHSPHGEGSSLRRLWHAHAGWLFGDQGRADRRRYAPDLLADRRMLAIDRAFPLFIVLGLAIPFGLGLLLTGTWIGGLTGLLWGGLIRVAVLHHAIFSVNSIAHYFGSRRFRTDDQSRNVFWLAPISLGESWHHNHHAFPRSAMHGLRWWELDPAGLLIRALAALGLAWDVVSVAEEVQRGQLIDPSSP
jgi:stearoyl-CoA desaturase (Delta-9 desaturase)